MDETKYRTLVMGRAYAKGKLTRIIKDFENNPQPDIDEVENQREKLIDLNSSFEMTQLDIDIVIEDEPDPEKRASLVADQDAEKANHEARYMKCRNFISKRLREINATTLPQIHNQTLVPPPTRSDSVNTIVYENNSLLPKIEIRPFDGNPVDWYSFHDTFLSLVHNDPRIPSVQKFHILKNALQGSLTTIMSSLSASEENYTVAWDLLKSRCDRPRQIINTHIKSLIELPEITKDSPSSIRQLKEQALMHFRALEALKEPVGSWNSVLVYIIVQKLDKTTRRTWERTLEQSDKPSFMKLIDFLSKQERGEESEPVCNSSSNKQSSQSSSYDKRNSRNKQANPSRGQAFVGTQSTVECAFCSRNHPTYNCEDFLKYNPRDRYAKAKEKRLCVNCLRSGHLTMKCSSIGCRKCNKRHHTLLHFSDSNEPNVDRSVQASSTPSTLEIPRSSFAVTHDAEVLLGTARVIIFDRYNNKHECRVLLDGGSQSHFVTESLAEKLQLNKQRIHLPFAGLGETTTRADYSVIAKLSSRTTNFQTEVELVALPTITGLLPTRMLNKHRFTIPKEVRLADPEFNKPGAIDALIGAALFYKLLCVGQIELQNNKNVVLQKTLFGWVVTGEVESMKAIPRQVRSCHLSTSLEDKITRFWQIEEPPSLRHLSPAEKQCEDLYATTTRRDSDGRYIVRLPFNGKQSQLGDSYNRALACFHSLERRLTKNPSLKDQYANFINEYLTLGHMKEITNADNKAEGYYIPHHAVIKENNLTTKLRVVFNASSKGTTGLSLNDALLTGPTLHDGLLFIIMRARLHNIVINADIIKMYRQVKINYEDSIYQKILWRDDPSKEVRVFQLTTATQGTAAAPFLSSRTLTQLALDEGHRYPLAAKSLERDFYVDDLFTGVNTLEEAKELKSQLTELLKLGGFHLHKWASNDSDVVENDNTLVDPTNIIDETSDKKVLGINWNPTKDIIKYSVSEVPNKRRYTKRLMLSEIAQLFDPLGILGPVIVIAKIMMQELWKEKLQWDESLPLSIHSKWLSYKGELPLLNSLEIPRQLTLKCSTDYQLHGFADASEHAYGACVYLRTVDDSNKCIVHLVCSKSRVAPLKTMSIPRLELCAAHLLANLMNTIIGALRLNYSKVCYWSDSTITLHWINMSPHSLKTFVANRVAEIQTLTNIDEWRHVSTSDNPADFVSRGQFPSLFIKNTLWLHGPTWLASDEANWMFLTLPATTVPEQRSKTVLTVTNVNQFNDTLERFSSISKLNRFVALCLRFVNNIRMSVKRVGTIEPDELNAAHMRIITIIQQRHFAQELSALRRQLPLPSKSKLLCLTPFLDSQGIIRVGGRIANSNLSYSKKFPILLPRDNHVTKLIISNEHVKNWHAGVLSTLNAIRNTYWPIDGKNVVRHHIRNA